MELNTSSKMAKLWKPSLQGISLREHFSKEETNFISAVFMTDKIVIVTTAINKSQGKEKYSVCCVSWGKRRCQRQTFYLSSAFGKFLSDKRARLSGNRTGKMFLEIQSSNARFFQPSTFEANLLIEAHVKNVPLREMCRASQQKLTAFWLC